MIYLDNIMDALMEVRLFEMAHQRKNVIDKTRYLATHIATHIAKVALYPQHSARKHWEKEIHAACDNINNNKYDGKKKLRQTEYFKILHDEPITDTDFVKDVAKSGIRNDGMSNDKWSDADIHEMNRKISNVYQILSKQLSENDYEHISHTLNNCEL